MLRDNADPRASMARASVSGARMSMRSEARGSRVLSIRQTRMSIRFGATKLETPGRFPS